MEEYWILQKKKQEWLNTLKAGDEVGLQRHCSWGPGEIHFLTVSRTTATQIHVSWARDRISKFRREGGREMVEGYHADSLVQPTDELKQELKAEKERNQFMGAFETTIKDTKWRQYPTEVLQKILDILAAANKIES